MKRLKAFQTLSLMLILTSCQTSFTGFNPVTRLAGVSLSPKSVTTRGMVGEKGTSMRIDGNASAVHSGYMHVTGVSPEERFEYVKEDYPLPHNLNITIFGMAALKQTPGSFTILEAADNANLTNKGTIDISFNEIDRMYADQCKVSIDGPEKYDNIMGWGMLAGKNSTLVNEGVINMYLDMNPEDKIAFVVHPMYVYENSSMINNGKINIVGNGSVGTQIRGLTSSHDNLTIVNNGTLHIDVADSYMSRGLATTGTGGKLTNNGLIYTRSSSVIYGMSQNGGNILTNNGVMELVSKGYTPKEPVVGIFPICTANVYGFGNAGTAPADAYYINNGVLKARIEGDGETDPYSAAFGMYLCGQKEDKTLRYFSNTGIIDVSSTVLPSAANGYQQLTSEMGLNLAYTGVETDKYAKAKIGKWATTLRDFATTKDLFNGRNGTFDLSEAELILRPDQNYEAGIKYDVSQSALVHQIDLAKENDNELTVVGYERMKFSTEMPEFLKVNLTEQQEASLELVNHKESTQAMIGSAVMVNMDMARTSMSLLDEQLGNRKEDGNNFFITPYIGHLNRKNALEGSIYGLLVGSTWQIGDKWSIGVHAGYNQMDGNGSFYDVVGKVKGGFGGIHAKYTPEKNLYFRGQFSGFLNDGENTYSVNHTGAVIRAVSPNETRGLYASLTAGTVLPLGNSTSLQMEVGGNSLNVFHLPQVKWNLLGESIPGYDMSFSRCYRSVYVNGMIGLSHEVWYNESSRHTFKIGAGVRGKAWADQMVMRMIKATFTDRLSEDNQIGMVRFSYQWNKNDYYLGCSYNGDFGSKASSNVFVLNIGKKF